MKKKYANFSFVFKILVLGLLILMGKFGQKSTPAYVYAKQKPVHLRFDSTTVANGMAPAFFEKVIWNTKK